MKKLLCGFVCAAAGAALAVESPTVATVDVIAIDSGLKNTVVAIPGLDLAGDDLVVSNLVKTTNLKAGDTLYAFNDGEYDSWTLDEDGGHWQHADKKYIITANSATEGTPTASADMQMSVGSGIWLSRCGTRSTYTTGNPFYVYAAHVDSKTSTVGSSVTLVGNPLTSTLASAPSEIDNKAKGDEIQIPQNGTPITFTYNGTDWVSWSTGERVVGFPAIVPGTGFWYRPADGRGRTIHW
jgi:hypothetical protein